MRISKVISYSLSLMDEGRQDSGERIQRPCPFEHRGRVMKGSLCFSECGDSDHDKDDAANMHVFISLPVSDVNRVG